MWLRKYYDKVDFTFNKEDNPVRISKLEVARKIFYLRDIKKLSYQDIADELDISKSKISKTLNDPELRERFGERTEDLLQMEKLQETICHKHYLSKQDYDIILEKVGGEDALKLLVDDFFHQAKMGRIRIMGNDVNWGILDEAGYGDQSKSIDYVDPDQLFEE